MAGAVLAIRPGRSDPELALPTAANACIVCHNVSDDGSTLFALTAKEPGDDYSDGSSYDLKNNGAVIQSYTGGPGGPNDRKFLWSALSKDGTYALQSSNNGADHTQEGYAEVSAVFRRDNAMAEVAGGFDGVITDAVTPAFSRDGKRVAFNYWSGSLAPGGGDGHTLDVMDFACGAPASVALGAPSCATFAFSNLKRLYTTPTGYAGWPAWLPDSSGIVFQNTIKPPKDDAPLSTWHGALADLWYVNANGTPAPVALHALNGDDSSGMSTLPTPASVALHANDDQLNYEPTVNPIVSGGYAWVVFTSRRMYGNVAQGDPFVDPEKVKNITANNKKLWVAAIDLAAPPGKDPSHPAFYLPGQELAAGNMRGFWVVDPCHGDGTSCATGDECCSGYCRPDGAGKLVCGGKPEQSCSQEFEKCTQSGDCCAAGADLSCVNGYCTRAVVK